MLKLAIKAMKSSDFKHQPIDLRIYMHALHKTAEKNRQHFLAEMIKSKCFWC